MAGLLASSAASYATPGSTVAPGGPRDPDVDDGVSEVGVEWDTDSGARPYWYDSAIGVYNWLTSVGWQGNFKWANSQTWEEDFKAAANGGTEHLWVDTVDLALVGTHGSGAWDSFWGAALSSVWFSTTEDDQHLSPGEALLSYGDGDLEWLAIDSCSVLNDGSIAYWATTFNGLHLLLGFANTMYVNYPGDGSYWGFLMAPKPWCPLCPTLNVTQSWFIGTDWNQPAGVRARVLAEELDNYNDYIWGVGYVSPDYAPDDDFWWWDHVSGTPEPRPLNDPLTTLPIYQVVPRQVNGTYVQGVGQALGLEPAVYSSPDGSYYAMTGSGGDNVLLIVLAASGSYYYLDTDLLWQDPPQALPASADEARQVAMNFLVAHDTLPGVFGFDPAITPTAVLEGQTQGVPGQVPLREAGLTNPMNYAVSYARTVEVSPGQTLSIVGPGSRQNVYISGNNEVVGIVGGWRDVQMVAGSSVPVKTSDDAWSDFLANPETAVAHVPAADLYDLAGNPAPALAYYEQPTSLGQAELIPVWVFVADLYVETAQGLAPEGLTLLAEDAKIYVPASAEPAALPQATILTPPPGTVLAPGETVDLSGAASGGVAPLSYEWSSDVDGFLGSGPAVNDVLLSPNLRTALPAPNVVTLRVTDANGLTATATVEVLVVPPLVFLPAVLRP
ncbi:MAG: DUF6345 domain-containing protein [Chloroflexi bacterium]|nr:DUF6345 domain-containing protein [Chloroflexota bacterium]MCI0728731.1 DUF6345 domain-containing protein [Chloroflexota bacterium]